MQYFYRQFGWGDLLSIAVVLVLFYFALIFLKRILSRIISAKKTYQTCNTGLEYLLLIYEPLIVLIITSVFIFINPMLHGLLVALILLVCFIPIRNYFSGRLIQFTEAIHIGEKICTKNAEGVIAETGRFGLKLRSDKGMHFIGYSSLLSDGFMMLSGTEIGGFHQLKIVPKTLENNTNNGRQLKDLLYTAPYIDWNNSANTFTANSNASEFSANLLVRKDGHFQDLITLIEERGYIVTIQNNI